MGICRLTSEESFTSGTSFLDGEEPIKENYDKSRRVYRGLFVTKKGEEINADVNGSYQIMKKVFPNAFSDGIVGVGLHPTVVNIPLWTAILPINYESELWKCRYNENVLQKRNSLSAFGYEDLGFWKGRTLECESIIEDLEKLLK